MIYEYECSNGHRTEQVRPVRARHDAVTCKCGESATLVISLPSRRPNYGGGIKVAPWLLPPIHNPDGTMRMQDVTVFSREEYLGVLRKNGLRELETDSDHLVQGGQQVRGMAERKTRELDAEADACMSDFAAMKSNPGAARKVIAEHVSAGKKAIEISDTSLKAAS